MATNNTDLHTARLNAADEFYTAYEDIELEMKHYSFNNKVVLCPCDNYKRSNFYKYFKNNFKHFSLKLLICISYPDGTIIEYDGITEHNVIEKNFNGDFRSTVTYSYMLSSDVIVTNPPFSLFRTFMDIVLKSNKQFIILGNINAITYKEIFPFIVNEKLRLGVTIHSGDREFLVPDDYPLDGTATRFDNSTNSKFIRVKGVRWYTNMKMDSINVKHTILTNKYDSSKYEKFDDYDAINVNTMKEIPYDYAGMMGVPITVMDKMNYDGYLEFKTVTNKIVRYKVYGMLNSGNHPENYDYKKPIINGKCKFKRLLIKKI